MKKLLLIALSTFAASANAWEPTFYVGGNYSAEQFEPSALHSNFTVKSLEGVGGVKLFDYIAVEGRIGAGLGEDRENAKFDPEGANREVMSLGVNFYGSVYLKPYIANEKASFYALLGYTSVDLDMSNANLSEDDSVADLSYGLGATFKMTDNVDLVVEWRHLINADDFYIRGGAIGFTYSF